MLLVKEQHYSEGEGEEGRGEREGGRERREGGREQLYSEGGREGEREGPFFSL